MSAFREVKLPSGAILKVAPAPFEDSNALYKAILKEGKAVSLGSKSELAELIKNMLCSALSSDDVEEKLKICFSRCLYCDKRGDLKIDKDTFQPVEARKDYTTVCMEVATENVSPFMTSLYALFSQALEGLETTLASRPPTTL